MIANKKIYLLIYVSHSWTRQLHVKVQSLTTLSIVNSKLLAYFGTQSNFQITKCQREWEKFFIYKFYFLFTRRKFYDNIIIQHLYDV